MEEMNKLLGPVVDLIRKYGWTQGKFHDSRGYCILGAIHASYSSDPLLEVVCKSLIRERIGGEYSSIVAWNDAPNRTIEEVLDVLTN